MTVYQASDSCLIDRHRGPARRWMAVGQPISVTSKPRPQIETKKKLATNAMPNAHTTDRNIAQSAR